MKCTVDYKQDNERGILIRTFSGFMNVRDLIDSWKYTLEIELSKGVFKGIITDYRAAEIHVEMQQLRELDAFFKKNMPTLKHLLIAQVIDSPKIVFPMLLSKQYPHIQIKAFSTMEAAMEWMSFNYN